MRGCVLDDDTKELRDSIVRILKQQQIPVRKIAQAFSMSEQNVFNIIKQGKDNNDNN